jgi:hypothetical protein
MSDECLICGGPTTEYGACERTLEALRRDDDPDA